MLLIEINNLRIYYMACLIIDIDNLKIYSEDKIGIGGLNGALLNFLTGKTYPDEGTIKLNGNYSQCKQQKDAEFEKQLFQYEQIYR